MIATMMIATDDNNEDDSNEDDSNEDDSNEDGSNNKCVKRKDGSNDNRGLPHGKNDNSQEQ